MFENVINFFRKLTKKEKNASANSKDTAKERLHLVLMQDRANVSADFLELMKQEIIDVIKKYIDIDESAIDVRLTNKENDDGTNGAPALYANIPILNIKNEARVANENKENENTETSQSEQKENTNNSSQNQNENQPEEKPDEKQEEQEEQIKENINEDKETTIIIDNDKQENSKEEENTEIKEVAQ